MNSAQPKKRRGRPPKARPAPEGVDAAPELVTAPSEPQDALQEVIEAPRKTETKPKPPMPPILAKEVMDHILSKYDWKPGQWRALLNTLTYMQRMGRYFSLQTRK